MIFLYKLIAHRGIWDKKIKENSLIAIKNALKSNNYVGVEFDIRETLDNEIILYHNAIYNNKLVSKTLYKEMPKYVPRLEDVLKINSNKIFLIEVKNIKNNFKKFIKLLYKYQHKKIYVMSFSNKIIDKINTTDRKYKIGILNYVLNTNENIKKLDFIGILNSILNEDIKKQVKNLEIFSYGIFSKKKLKDIYYIIDDKDL